MTSDFNILGFNLSDTLGAILYALGSGMLIAAVASILKSLFRLGGGDKP